MTRLILASASPRRGDLLRQLRVDFTTDPAAMDETLRPGEAALDYVERMAREKAAIVALRHELDDAVVLAADTCVVIDDDILGKPMDHFAALAMLARLSGRRHEVMTAVCLQGANGVSCAVVTTAVNFVQLTRAQCESYLATDEPWDKAGAYAIQGLAGAFVSSIEGSYSNVVGLPLAETWQLLSTYGVVTGLGAAGG